MCCGRSRQSARADSTQGEGHPGWRRARDRMARKRRSRAHDRTHKVQFRGRSEFAHTRREIMSGVEIVTFGCRLNAYESEAIRARAADAGLTDAIIVNTCAVTAEAVRQSRQAIRKLRRESPHAPIIVTGCAAQTEPETYAAMREVNHVLGNQEKLSAENYGRDFLAGAPRVLVNDIMAVKETAEQFVDSLADHTRAVLEVKNGGAHRCPFCIIPLGGGIWRGVGAGGVAEEARGLARAGSNEIVLSGVALAAYGGDLPGERGLGSLVARILKHGPELPRLR